MFPSILWCKELCYLSRRRRFPDRYVCVLSFPLTSRMLLLIVTELFKRVGAVNPQKYEGICVACFGVLSQASDQVLSCKSVVCYSFFFRFFSCYFVKSTTQVFLESIFCELKTSGYDFSDYSLSVTLPASLTLRQYSIWLHLCEILPETFFSSKYGSFLSLSLSRSLHSRGHHCFY